MITRAHCGRATARRTAVCCPASPTGPCEAIRARAAVARSARTSRSLKCSAAAEAVDPASTPTSQLPLYETLIVLKPTLIDDERDQELARFETFLVREECQDIKATVRGRHRMAYPIKGNWEGIYVRFEFRAKPSIAPKVQKLLSTPPAGSEDSILRHMTKRCQGARSKTCQHIITMAIEQVFWHAVLENALI